MSDHFGLFDSNFEKDGLLRQSQSKRRRNHENLERYRRNSLEPAIIVRFLPFHELSSAFNFDVYRDLHIFTSNRNLFLLQKQKLGVCSKVQVHQRTSSKLKYSIQILFNYRICQQKSNFSL